MSDFEPVLVSGVEHFLTAIGSTHVWLVFGCSCGTVIFGDATDALAMGQTWTEHRDQEGAA